MEVCIDHARQHDLSRAIDAVIDTFWAFISRLQNFDNPTVIADHQTGEAVNLTIFTDGNALDIVNQRIGRDGCRKQHKGGQGEYKSFHRPHSPRSEEHTSELQSLMRTSYAVF